MCILSTYESEHSMLFVPQDVSQSNNFSAVVKSFADVKKMQDQVLQSFQMCVLFVLIFRYIALRMCGSVHTHLSRRNLFHEVLFSGAQDLDIKLACIHTSGE